MLVNPVKILYRVRTKQLRESNLEIYSGCHSLGMQCTQLIFVGDKFP